MEALLPLIIQYSIQYGIPAVVSLIDIIKKPSMTWDEIQAAFKVAETPYGLTPQITGDTPTAHDLGVIIPPVSDPPTGTIPTEFQTSPFVIVKISHSGQGVTICNAKGNCWLIFDESTIVKTAVTGPDGQVWQVGNQKFFVLPEALK